ncbi:MAG: hypothetical protein JOZ75_05195 [Candidatus Dormibacteraeota bacterium]|nr:hypothetical protein [Candidatus Dormibacteraeota bacterium]
MRLGAATVRGAGRWCARVALPASIVLTACGTSQVTPSHTTRQSPSATAQNTTPASSPGGSSPAPAAATPGDFGNTPEGLRFTWTAGYSQPPWLPAFIAEAPAAPSGGSVVCGVDPASGLFTALVRYDPTSQAGAITIQIQPFHGADTYTNTSASNTPADVEVSPPAPSLTGLSGFGVVGASVTVDQDLKSGTVQSSLQSGAREAGAISGNWRCG